MTEVFVFGSNLAGIHGAGSAREAFRKHGAVWGEGVGRHGLSYAIPTKDQTIRSLPLSEIRKYVDEFKRYAESHPYLTFRVVKIGCGLAGFSESDIMPMFEDSPDNCILPIGWRKEKRDV